MKIIAKFTVTWILATLLILACVVSAMGLSTEEPVPAPDPDATSTVYYISDNPLSSTYRQMLLNSGVVSNCVLKYYDTTEFVRSVQTLFMAEDVLADASGGYVIFEMQESFPREMVEEGETPEWIEWLEDTFSWLKEHNCEIMFISGTDEKLYEGFEGFLDYVDVHVNTDMWYLFYTSVFHYIGEDTGDDMRFQNVTILLDKNLSGGAEAAAGGGWFINKIFMPLLRMAYRDAFRGSALTNYDIMSNRNIKLICQINDEIFYDVAAQRIYTPTEQITEFYNVVENAHIYAIGAAYDTSYTGQWLTWIDRIESAFGDVPTFIYDPDGFGENLCDEHGVYRTGPATDIYPLMYDFVRGQDMTGYNNWTGACQITHKTVRFSPGGWMVLVGLPENSAFQRCMSEAEYLFYLCFDNDALTDEEDFA